MSLAPLLSPGLDAGADRSGSWSSLASPDLLSMRPPIAPLLAVLVLVPLLAPAASRAAEAFAVLPVAEPPGPDAALVDLAREVRAALEARGAGVLTPEALRLRMTGGVAAEVLAATDARYHTALEIHASGDFEGSIRTLRATIADLELLPCNSDVHAQWQRAMLRLARSEQAVGRRGEAQAVLQRLLSVDAALEVDTRLYPPGFQRLVEEVRAETRALWTRKLSVVADPGVEIWVEGRSAGPAPATVELPPGRYRISGTLGGIRSREVLVDLTAEDRRVELDLSLAELLHPDRGPGLGISGGDRLARTLAVARFLDLDRVVAVRVEPAEGGRPGLVLSASIQDARRGTPAAAGRVRLVSGALPPGAADALAAYLLAGDASPQVEAVPVVSLAPVLPRLDAPRHLLWDGVKRPEARRYGWWSTGTGALALALGGVAVWQAVESRAAYADARGMLDEGGQVAYGHTVAEYNRAIRRGDRSRALSNGSAIGAGAFAVSAVVLGVISYRRTGEIGPIRF